MELTIKQGLQQGAAAYSAGNFQEAERAYQAILKIQPQHPDANHNLGLIAISVNQIEAALSFFKIAVDVNPNIEQFWLSYIYALVKANRLKDAKQGIKKAKKKGIDNKKLDALLLQSKILSNNEVPRQEQLNRLLEHYQNGRYVEAEKLALIITQEFPKNQFCWKVLGAVLKQVGRISESLVVGQKTIKLAPQDAEAHNILGVTLKELGRLNEAEVSYTQAIALNPDYADAYINLGNTLKELGRLDEAEVSHTQAIALKPHLAEAHYNLGITLQELGRSEEAEASCMQAIALKPNYAEAHYNLGVTLQELGRSEEAEASYRQAIVLKPDYALAHFSLCKVLYVKGNEYSALESIVKANDIEPLQKDYELLLSVMKGRKSRKGNTVKVGDMSNINALTGLTPSSFVVNRVVEAELIASLYEMNSIELDKTKRVILLPSGNKDSRYGSGTVSADFNLFKDARPIIQKLAENLTKIMMEAVNSDIYIFDSFFNILSAGGGTTPHNHLSVLDEDVALGIGKQKYSLVYYLSVGDQNCSEPGILKLYEPAEDILPSEGMIVILPASRSHSAVYGGEKDRVMIGVNFYSL